MASFTDEPVQFNPYIAHQDVDAMRQVGMLREQQFQEGLNKVQSYIDNTLNLPIAKNETKQYIQQKVQTLGNNLKNSISGAGDFSKQGIVRNVGGLIGQITNDPIVRNGVQSTARIQQGYADIEKAKKEGKWSQQNEDYFNTQVGRWTNDGDIETAFDGEFTNWVDYQKKFIDIYKEMNKGENIDQDAFRIDAQGNITINPTLREGITPEKIRSAWNLVSSSPEVQQQLQIDGWTKYRGLDNQSLVNNLAQSTNSSLREIDKTINNLSVELITSDSVKSEVIAQKIQQLKERALDIKNNGNLIMESIRNNPERAKTMLYENDYLNNLMGTFSYEVQKKSFLWEASQEERKYNNELLQWSKEFELKEKNFELEKDKAKYQKEKDAREAEASGVVSLPVPVSDNQRLGSASAYSNLENNRTTYEQSQRELINSASGMEVSPYRFEEGKGWVYNVGNARGQYKSINDAYDVAKDKYAKLKDEYINGRIEDPTIKSKMDAVQQNFDRVVDSERIIKESEGAVAPLINQLRESIGDINIPVNFNGSNKVITSQDLFDLYSIGKGLATEKGAKARLDRKYGNSNDLKTWIQSRSLVDPIGATYGNVIRTLDRNKKLVDISEQIENEFASRQTTLQDQYNTYSLEKTNPEINKRNFIAVATNIAQLDPSSNNGQAAEMIEALNNKDAKNNTFHSTYSPETNRGRLILQTSERKEPYVLDVSGDTYFRLFPDQQVDYSFREKFGTRLSLGRGTTNVDGGGRANAYQVKPKGSDYTIQYHLKEDGRTSNGKLYEMYWWVTPKNSDRPIIDGKKVSQIVDGFPIQATTGEVMKWIKQFESKDWLDGIIRKQQLLKEQQK